MKEEAFNPGPFEKMQRLTALLSALDKDRLLKGKLALHGGTAINAFYFDLPRMSVDVDLSFVGEVSRDELPTARKELLERIREVAARLGYSPQYGKDQYAGRTIKLRYQGGMIKADVNFMNRVPLLPPRRMASFVDGRMSFPMLSPYDVFGGKVRAVLGRTTPRDLFDIATIAKHAGEFDEDLLHGSLLLYATLSDLFPQTYEGSFTDSMGRFDNIEDEIAENLLPMLAVGEAKTDPCKLVGDAAGFIRDWIDPRDAREREYVERMRRADFRPELILPSEVADRARKFPEALWKVKNLERYSALPSPESVAARARKCAQGSAGAATTGRPAKR